MRKQVILWLNELPVDLVELSGGSYESPAMQAARPTAARLAREAYFLEFAKELASVARMPLMTTGGRIKARPAPWPSRWWPATSRWRHGDQRSRRGCLTVPARWQAGEDRVAQSRARRVEGQGDGRTWRAWRWSRNGLAPGTLRPGRTTAPRHSAFATLLMDQLRMKRLTRRYRRWNERALPEG